MKKIGGMQQAILEDTIARWKALKESTRNHELMCVCSACRNRRRMGGMLIMPYAGPVNTHNTSLREPV